MMLYEEMTGHQQPNHKLDTPYIADEDGTMVWL